jgi:23S rRNA (uracil1939-C5)-methyltransferase
MVEIDRCPIADDALNAVVPALREAASRMRATSPFTIEPVAGEDGQLGIVARGGIGDPVFAARILADMPGIRGAAATNPSRGHRWAVEGNPEVSFPTDGGNGGLTTLVLDPRGFTQANRRLNPALAATIREFALAGPGIKVLELFAGAGNLTIPMALAGADVTAVELNREALLRAGEELKARGLNAILKTARVEELSADPDLASLVPDVVVADPPRTGLGPVAAHALARMPLSHVVICSCEPSTLARDLTVLMDSGFRLDRIALVDMFPQTFHIETVVSLVR